MSIPQKYIALADQLVLSGTSFFLVLFVARFLSLEDLGLFSIIFLFTLTAGSFLQAYIIRPLMVLGGKKEQLEVFVQNMYQLNGVSVFLASTLSTLALPLYLKSMGTVSDGRFILLAFLFSFFYLSNEFLRKSLYLKKQALSTALSGGICSFIQLIGLVYFYFTQQFYLEYILLLLIAAHVLQFIISSIQVGVLKNKWASITTVRKTALECFDYSKWLINKAGVQWLSGNFILLATGSILGPAALGAIKIAQHITGIVSVLLLTIENLIPQSASAIYQRNGATALRKYTEYATGKLVLFSFPALLIILISAPYLLPWIYGTIGSTEILTVRIFCIIQMLVILISPLRFAILAMEETKGLFGIYLITAAVAFFLSYPMINSMGIMGTFILLFSVQVINLLALLFLFQRKSKAACESYT